MKVEGKASTPPPPPAKKVEATPQKNPPVAQAEQARPAAKGPEHLGRKVDVQA